MSRAFAGPLNTHLLPVATHPTSFGVWSFSRAGRAGNRTRQAPAGGIPVAEVVHAGGPSVLSTCHLSGLCADPIPDGRKLAVISRLLSRVMVASIARAWPLTPLITDAYRTRGAR